MEPPGPTPTPGQLRRHYAPLALCFGVLVMPLRIVSVFAFPLTMDLDRAAGLVTLFGFVGTIAALAGVAHAAIAGSRGERGPVLWFAWTLNVLGALLVPDPFPIVGF